MKITHSPLSPTVTITALETIQSLLANSASSLSAFEKAALSLFAISLAENMAINPEGRITMQLSSAIRDANMAQRAKIRLAAVITAIASNQPGAWAEFYSANSNLTPLPTSLGMCPRSGPKPMIQKDDTLPLLECLSARE